MIPQKRKREKEEEEDVESIEPVSKKIKLDNEPVKITKKFPKRKICIIFSYLGTNYRGSQIQNNVNDTVEQTIFSAIMNAGAISKINFLGGPQKVQWKRCSRTDKGVHALFNVISLKALLIDDLLNKINMNLPDDVFVHGFKRVTGGFFPKNQATGRQYEYIIPTFMFANQEKLNSIKVPKMDPATKNVFIENNLEFVIQQYKLDVERFEKINSLFKNFVGTKFYGNFTRRNKSSNLKSFYRFITSCQISKPFMIKSMEYVRINIDGQSFVLNQIRKMVGLVVSIMQGRYKEEIFSQIFSEVLQFRVPMAPALGLYLRSIDFGPYNRRKSNVHGGIYYKDYEQSIVKFEENMKVHMFEVESKENIFKNWIVKEHVEVSLYGIVLT